MAASTVAKSKTAPSTAPVAPVPSPVTTPPETAPAAPQSANAKKGVRWRQRTAVALKALTELFPDIAKSIEIVNSKLMTLDADFAPNPKSTYDIEVGDEVTLPNHESIIKAMKAEPVATVTAVARGKATVKFSTGASMTVAKSECRAVL